MNKEFRTRVEGELNIDRWKTKPARRRRKYKELHLFQPASSAGTEKRKYTGVVSKS
mgnify:CR=1 FL=1